MKQKKQKKPELPGEPNFTRDVPVENIPYVYVDLLLHMIGNMKAMRLQISHLVAVVEGLAISKPDEVRKRTLEIVEMSNEATVQEYQDMLLSLSKLHSKPA